MLPLQTPVEVMGVSGEFVSGNRGEVFVELPQCRGNRVIARPVGSPSCNLNVDLPNTDLTVPYLEPMTCQKSP